MGEITLFFFGRVEKKQLLKRRAPTDPDIFLGKSVQEVKDLQIPLQLSMPDTLRKIFLFDLDVC